MNDCRSLIEAGFDKFKIPNVNRVSTFADQVAAYDLYSKRIVIKSLSGQNILHTVSDRMFGETRDIELAGDGVVQLGPVWDGDTFNPDGIAVTRVSHDGNVLHAEAIHAVKDTEAAEHFSLFFPMQESGISVDSEGRVWVITASEGEVFRYTDKGDLDYASDVFYDFRIPINKDLKSVLYKSFENRTMYLCDFPLIEGFETPTPEAALLVKKEPVGRDKKIGWQYRWIPSSEPTWRELASPNWADCFTTLRMSSSEDFTVLLYRRRSGDSNVSALYRCEASTPHLQ